MSTQPQPEHPLQPLIQDEKGVARFKENKIVTYLLDNGGIDLNRIAVLDFPVEDREQFAQLIGYSLSGFYDLSYVRDSTIAAAEMMAKSGDDSNAAKLEILRKRIKDIQEAAKQLTLTLYNLHEDDLEDRG